MSDTALARQDTAAQASEMLTVLTRAVDSLKDNPNAIASLRELLAMHKEILADQRKQAFMEAMGRLQAKLPQICKDGKIVVKGTERSRFARLETIDEAIRPLLAEEGFSFSFNEESADGAMRSYSAKLAHREGHAETYRITLPIDTSDFRSACQSAGSTNSYARRYLIKMALNIVEVGEDNDGSGPQGFITADQVRDLETALSDTKANVALFLKHFEIKELKDLPAREFHTACTMIEAKKRTQK